MEWIVFAQHGMADTAGKMAALARGVAPSEALVVAPELGFWATFWDLQALVDRLRVEVEQVWQQYPRQPARLIATSLGGVVWVELLHRHPDWWPRFESLVWLGSPLGGSHLAWLWGPIGIAKDLRQSRRPLAETLAARIPTLVVASDMGCGSDGTVAVGSTQIKYAHFVCLRGVSHPALRTHPAVAAAIRQFWQQPCSPCPPADTLIQRLIDHFRAVPGITDTDYAGFSQAKVLLTARDGTTLRTWIHPLGLEHLFIGDPWGACVYAGFVGWQGAGDLARAVQVAQTQFGLR
ncbi:MAG: hypothetical protein Q6K99_09350 [Thermostichales cyanobacterium BF4_bins_65]